jgi:hypothetical protein
MIASLLRQRLGALTALCVIAALQVGCSGGGGDTLAGGGIGGTGVTVASVGTVSGFGSVIVNGVAYDTAGAGVFVENAPRGSGDSAVVGNLLPGMVVRVEGRLFGDGSATAESVFFSSNLKGPVESLDELDSLTKQAIILGQVILMDDRTAFLNVSPASIAVGMVLEVSGLDDESGRILATFVKKVADSLPLDGEVELKGVVRNVTPPLQRFEIRQMTVDYSAADLGGLGGTPPEAGQLVKVRGRLEPANVLVAERLELEEEFGSRPFDVVELEGIISQGEAAGQFGIGRYTVRVDRGTSFNSLAPQDLNPGTRVVVHGSLTGRTILAGEIFLPERIRIESDVSSVDFDEKSLALAGLEPIRVFSTATTLIIGIASAFDHIGPGNHLRVLGRQKGGDIVASTMVITPSRKDVELAGPVQAVLEPFVTVLGIEIDTSSIPPEGFKDESGNPLLPDGFFGVVQPGSSVSFEGVLQGESVNWVAVTLESGN